MQVVRSILEIGFVLLFLAVVWNNIVLRRQLTAMERRLRESSAAISTNTFRPGDRLESILLTEPEGREVLIDLRHAATPTLFAVIEPACESCAATGQQIARLRRDKPPYPTRIISLGNAEQSRAFAQRHGLEGDLYLLPPNAPLALRQKLLTYPQAFVAGLGGQITAVCRDVGECAQRASTRR